MEKSAGAIIFRKEDSKVYYLLLHYQAGHWDFPKGHIEKGEDGKAAAKREVEEETGIADIEFLENFKKFIKYFFRKEGKSVFKTVVFYLVKTETKDIQLSFEHIGYKWLSCKEAYEKLTFKNAKELLTKANKYITKA